MQGIKRGRMTLCHAEKNTKVWEEREEYDKGTHREGNERLKTFKMRRDLVTLNDTRRGSRLSSGY